MSLKPHKRLCFDQHLSTFKGILEVFVRQLLAEITLIACSKNCQCMPHRFVGSLYQKLLTLAPKFNYSHCTKSPHYFS